jgi:hypothetical protein
VRRSARLPPAPRGVTFEGGRCETAGTARGVEQQQRGAR